MSTQFNASAEVDEEIEVTFAEAINMAVDGVTDVKVDGTSVVSNQVANINGMASKTWVQGSYRTATDQDVIDEGKADIDDIPTKTSDLTNDSGFVTGVAVKSFVATYGTTTATEIATAVTAGKAIFCKYSEGGVVHQLSLTDDTDSKYGFTKTSVGTNGGITSVAGITVILDKGTNQWSAETGSDEIPTKTSELENDSGFLVEPSTGLAVGKYFRIASLDASGHAVLEAVDAPTGAISDVQVNGTSVVSSGVANVPQASLNVLGTVKVAMDGRSGVTQSNGLLKLYAANQTSLTSREYAKALAITTNNFDMAVKTAMTDGLGTAWTDAEKTGAWSRLNSIKTTMDSVAAAGASYLLGEQSSVSITMPTDALLGQEILVCFSSGSTACTLTCDLSGFSFVPKANKTSWIKFTLYHKADTSVSGDEDGWLVETKEG